MTKPSDEYILIAENEEDLREALSIAVRVSFSGRVLTAENAESAIKIMEGEESFPGLIVSDFEMPGGNGDVLFGYAQAKFPHVPFVVCSGHSEDEIRSKFPGATAILQKPNVLSPLSGLVSSLKKSEKNSVAYTPVRLSVLANMMIISCDFYVKLGADNYVKVIRSGDLFLPEDAKKYIEKKIIDLYLAESDAKDFLGGYQALLNSTASRSSISPEDLALLGADFMETTQKLANALGWTEEVVETAHKSISVAIKAVAANPDILSLIEARASQPGSIVSKHVTLSSLLACAISQKLEWASEFTQVKLSMAALLHDICLDDSFYEKIEEWNARARNRQDKTDETDKYRSHVRSAVEKIATIPGLPPDVDQIIMQHHEFPDGSGFPNGIMAGRISPLAAIFIFAEDLSLKIGPDNDIRGATEEFLKNSRSKYSAGVFRKILKAFEEGLSSL